MSELDQKIQSARELITRELAKPGAACITSSFQAECVVLMHMLKEERPNIPVLFLETGYHFPETLEYRDQITRDWNLNLVNLEAKQSVNEQETLFGILNQTEPSKCCGLRKVEHLLGSVWFKIPKSVSCSFTLCLASRFTKFRFQSRVI